MPSILLLLSPIPGTMPSLYNTICTSVANYYNNHIVSLIHSTSMYHTHTVLCKYWQTYNGQVGIMRNYRAVDRQTDRQTDYLSTPPVSQYLRTKLDSIQTPVLLPSFFSWISLMFPFILTFVSFPFSKASSVGSFPEVGGSMMDTNYIWIVPTMYKIYIWIIPT